MVAMEKKLGKVEEEDDKRLDSNLVVEQNDDGDVDLGLAGADSGVRGALAKEVDGNETSVIDGDALDGGRVDGDTLLRVADVSNRGEAAAAVRTVGVGGRVGTAEGVRVARDVALPVEVKLKDGAAGVTEDVVEEEDVVAVGAAADGGAVVNPDGITALEGAEGTVGLVAEEVTVLVGVPAEDDSGALGTGLSAVGVAVSGDVLVDVAVDGGAGLDGEGTGGLAKVDADEVDGRGAGSDGVVAEDAIVNGEGGELGVGDGTLLDGLVSDRVLLELGGRDGVGGQMLLIDLSKSQSGLGGECSKH